jgi:hypothetical protein
MGLLRIRRECGVGTDRMLDKVARRQIVSDLAGVLQVATTDRFRSALPFFEAIQCLTGFSKAKTLVSQVQRCR